MAALVVVVAVTGIASVSGAGPAAGDDRKGAAVPTELVGVIAQASLSCPVLTSPRLAGQLMAETGFALDKGVAGLSDELWEKWRPWPDAARTDPAANVTALAHHMCDLIGQLRNAGADDELWDLALAAHRVGLPAVSGTLKVPDEAESYVSSVTGYSTWYEQNQLATGVTTTTGSATTSTDAAKPGSGTAPVPVPAEYVPLITSAARACPQINGAKLASQLMAASAFNPALLGPDGGQGIAQFLPEVWERYGEPQTSPWDPAAAVATLARTMCTLTADLSGLVQDPYPVALAAYQWGPASLSQRHGAPDAQTVKEYADQVLAYAAYYVQDTRLGARTTPPTAATGKPFQQPVPIPPAPVVVANTGTTAPGKPVKTRTASPTAGTAGAPAPTKTKTAAPKPTAAKTTAASEPTYQISGLAGKCLYAPAIADGQNLAIRTCGSGTNQRWRFPGDGTIRMGGLCMDLAGGGYSNGTRVQLARCNGTSAQKFTVNGSYDLVNTVYGRCADVIDRNEADGTGVQIWECTGGSNQKWTRRG